MAIEDYHNLLYWADDDAEPDPEPPARGQLTQLKDVRAYVFGGRGAFTLVSKETGNRLTFRTERKEVVGGDGEVEKVLHFVSVLTGPDNTEDYAFLGTIFDFGAYRHGKKSRIDKGAASNKAFEWFWRFVHDCGRLPSTMEFWHEGKCARCGRALTDPSSISTGLGPVCASKGA